MTGPTKVRHLVLGGSDKDLAAGYITTACTETDTAVPYDQQQHTFLTALTTCPDCLVVHAAWHTAFVASLG